MKNHALVDGNKRLGWLATAVFLEINGLSVLAARNDDVFNFVMKIASSESTVEEVATGLKAIAVPGRLPAKLFTITPPERAGADAAGPMLR